MMLPSRAASNLPNPQTVTQPSLKMHAALRGFTRQNFILEFQGGHRHFPKADQILEQNYSQGDTCLLINGNHMVPNVRYTCHNLQHSKKDGWTRKTQKTSVTCRHRLTFQEKRMPPSLSMLTIQASTAPEYSADTAGLVAQLFFSPRDTKPDVCLNYVKQNNINVSLNSHDTIRV